MLGRRDQISSFYISSYLLWKTKIVIRHPEANIARFTLFNVLHLKTNIDAT